MANTARISHLVECFWPGAREEDLRGLDLRIEASASALTGDGSPVRYLGWLLVIDDDVALVLFEGPIGKVRHVAEKAGIPFGRILQTVHALRPSNLATDEEVWE